MTAQDHGAHADDALLVAYLDGELPSQDVAALERRLADEAALTDRLAQLSLPGVDLAAAFAPLLEAAPQARLDSMLDSVSPSRQEMQPGRRGAVSGMIAAGLALLLAGAGGERLLSRHRQTREAEEGADHWRAVVASYLTLYTADTLASIPADAALRAAELDTVGRRLGLSLSPDLVSVPGAVLKRAQLLQYDGQPLGQIVYLDPAAGPLALCLVPSHAGAAPVRSERRRGLDIAYWSDAGHAFMLIGHQDAQALATAATLIAGRLT